MSTATSNSFIIPCVWGHIWSGKLSIWATCNKVEKIFQKLKEKLLTIRRVFMIVIQKRNSKLKLKLPNKNVISSTTVILKHRFLSRIIFKYTNTEKQRNMTIKKYRTHEKDMNYNICTRLSHDTSQKNLIA